jgi:hypothetical protein
VVSDRTNYAIGLHTDLPSRFVSLLFYLSPDQKYRSYVTSLYVPQKTAALKEKNGHHPTENFGCHSRVDYVDNRAVIFPRTDIFHGVEPVPVENSNRRLLIVNVRAPKGAIP